MTYVTTTDVTLSRDDLIKILAGLPDDDLHKKISDSIARIDKLNELLAARRKEIRELAAVLEKQGLRGATVYAWELGVMGSSLRMAREHIQRMAREHIQRVEPVDGATYWKEAEPNGWRTIDETVNPDALYRMIEWLKGDRAQWLATHTESTR